MKNKKEKIKLQDIFTLGDIKKAVEEVILPSQHNLQLDIDTKIENLARMVAQSFRNLDGKIEATDQRLILTREELIRKLDGTNIRIDDLAFNRVKYSDFDPVKKDVAILKTSLAGKNGKTHGA